MKAIYPLGEMPSLGEVPARMHAQVIRQDRYGEPDKAFRVEEIEVPADLAPDEVLVWVMAAGINYNNVWAGLGSPVDVIAARARDKDWPDQHPFHIGGSDASGIVWKVGSAVTDLRVGDHVVVHCGMWKADCPTVRTGGDPMFSPTFRIWGYEMNFGSFAQFTRVQAHQCLPKPPHLTWEAAAASTLVGATAYRMLMHWTPNTVQPGDVVLVWGGAGGLGCQAIQIAREAGGIPVAVISSDDKRGFCERLGAKGCIDRKQFDHWGIMPHWKDEAAYGAWAKGARAFGKAIWDVLGERRSPRIVFEHPGETTVPTSIFVCDTGGMVVICAGTTGYNAVVDLRYLWMRQKRFQGSHFANDEQSYAFNQLVIDGKIDPCLAETHDFDGIPGCHQILHENKAPEGKLVALVGAPKRGLKDLP
jgi:crotonyl-CoA carboxylase/reductase